MKQLNGRRAGGAFGPPKEEVDARLLRGRDGPCAPRCAHEARGIVPRAVGETAVEQAPSP